jgi:hypothetical protein
LSQVTRWCVRATGSNPDAFGLPPTGAISSTTTSPSAPC